MTKRPLDPDHDAVMFALDSSYSPRTADLAAAAIAAAADAVHRALSATPGASSAGRSSCSSTRWCGPTAPSEAPARSSSARRWRPRPPVCSPGASPRCWPTLASTSSSRAMRSALSTRTACRAPSAGGCSPSARSPNPRPARCTRPARARRRRRSPASSRQTPVARALTAGRRARLAERHRGVRPWLAAAPDITFTVRTRDRHDPPAIVCAPFVIADATPERALGANTYPEPMLELARRVPCPPPDERTPPPHRGFAHVGALSRHRRTPALPVAAPPLRGARAGRDPRRTRHPDRARQDRRGAPRAACAP